ncbi:MAG: hypothetical protein F4X41_08020 [Chloroflexi bacterium]|nr:hypothetical protein [Chloroflexota bacterium]
MNPRLKWIRSRINRAESLQSETNASVDAILREMHQEIHESREGYLRTWTFTGKSGLAPPEFSVKVGEIVHNLRSSLDHIVWELVLANGRKPTFANRYPITGNAKRFDEIESRALQGVASGAKRVIREFQPWWPTESGFELWSLNRLSNVDKHRHLHIAAVVPTGIDNHELPITADKSARIEGRIHIGPLERDKEVGWFRNLPEEYDPRIRLNLSFWGREGQPPQDADVVSWYAGQPVAKVLSRCLSDVRDVECALIPFLY